jgi:hypothetical protein
LPWFTRLTPDSPDAPKILPDSPERSDFRRR